MLVLLQFKLGLICEILFPYPSAEFSILTSGSTVAVSSSVCTANLCAASPTSPPDDPFTPHSSHFQLEQEDKALYNQALNKY